MKTPVALAFLILVLEASSCLARPDVSRLLLAEGDARAAGAVCADGELCSDGVSPSRQCPSTLRCPIISAGLPCLDKDLCSPGTITAINSDADLVQATACPSDPAIKSGVCPAIAAGELCVAKDRCATDATKTVVCPTSRNSNGIARCLDLLSGVSCSAITGACSGDEVCNATLAIKDSKVLTQAALNYQDSKTGLCIIPTQAGSPCQAGNICSGSESSVASTYCSASPCPLARPGQSCSPSNPIDKCYDDVTEGGSNCPSANGGGGVVRAQCTPLASGKACLFGDECAAGTICTAVGTSAGTCAAITTRAGLPCAQAITTQGSEADRDVCPGTAFDASGSLTAVGVLCPTGVSSAGSSNTCPFKAAGSACEETDVCSDGTDGTECDVTGTAPFTCPALGANAACFEGDACVDGQICSGKGITKGKCVSLVPAGASCTAATDTGFCAPNGAACPDGASSKCPLIPAGATCKIRFTVVGTSGQTGYIAPKAADLCSSGADVGAACTSQSTDTGATGTCPILATGLKCTANDVCVKGAQCIAGLCQPNSKAVVSQITPTPTPAAPLATAFSTEDKVPAVQSVAQLDTFKTADLFTASDKTTFCSTIQANILATYKVVSNCTINKVTSGSIFVDNTVSFTGADATAASTAQKALAQALTTDNGVATVFGPAYGKVTVSDISQPAVTNPTATKSGAAAVGMAWTVGVALTITVLAMTM